MVFSFQPLSPSANKVFAVIKMLIMNQHAQIYWVLNPQIQRFSKWEAGSLEGLQTVSGEAQKREMKKMFWIYLGSIVECLWDRTT